MISVQLDLRTYNLSVVWLFMLGSVCFLWHKPVFNTESLYTMYMSYAQVICSWFYCKIDDSGLCYTEFLPAMDGTICGLGKVSHQEW